MDKDNPNTKVGYNGHILLLIDGPRLTVEYHDIIDSTLLLTETFTPTGNGALQYESLKPPGSQLLSGQEMS